MFVIDKNLMPSPAAVTPAPFTLESLIAWLETKNPAEPYDWFSCEKCAIGQWLTATTGEKCPSGEWIYTAVIRNVASPSRAYNTIAGDEPHTFGAALTRARAYAEDEK